MAATIIRFDPDYMRDQAKNITNAQKLVDEALGSLRNANRNSGWRCRERDTVRNNLDDIKKMSSNISTNLQSLSGVVAKGAGTFEAWENRTKTQESSASAKLKKEWGFEATTWGPNGTMCRLPITQIPSTYQDAGRSGSPNLGDYGMFVLRSLAFIAGSMGGSIGGGLLGATTGTASGAVLGFFSSLKEKPNISDAALAAILPGGISPSNIALAKLAKAANAAEDGAFKSGVLGGVNGFFDGSKEGSAEAVEKFNQIFGADDRFAGILDPNKISAGFAGEIGEAERTEMVNKLTDSFLKIKDLFDLKEGLELLNA
ncbi:hypothetical protein AGMMS50276_09260 [Synergistales bacterium]|nr:hypothetical protein AGMMS50276_09260 [Synergistales bacterium]